MRSGVALVAASGAILAAMLSLADVPAHSQEKVESRWSSTVTGRAGPARRVRVSAIHSDGSPAAGARICLKRRDISWFREVDTREADAAGIVEFEAPTAGLHAVVLTGAPDVRSGWLYRGNPAHFVCFEIGAAERTGHECRLVVPRSGILHVVVDRGDLAKDDHVGISLRRYFPSGDLRHSHDQTGAPRPLFDETGRFATYEFRKLPAVRIEVRAFWRHGAATVTEVDLRPGTEPTVVRLASGARCDPVRFEYQGPPPPDGEGRHHTLQVNPFDRTRPDIGQGRFEGNPGAVRLTCLRPGRYMTVLYRANLAMYTEIPKLPADGPTSGDETVIRLEPPEDLWPQEGGRTVRVRVMRGHEGLSGPMIALAPARARHLVHGNWFRVTNAGRYVFDGVANGEYDVLLLDGLWGEHFGIEASPLQRRIRVQDDDVELEFRLE